MAFDSTFRTPIPGSSLAHKMGDLPHEKPPKYTDPNEALEYFWKQFHRKDILKQIWLLLEKGANVRNIAVAILFKAGLEGIIQMNLGIVISPTIAEMIKTIGEAKGIKGIKLMPKMRDKIAEAMLDAKMNEILGNPAGSPPLPFSALKGLAIPKPDDVTQASQQGINSEAPSDAHAQPQPTPPNPAQQQQSQGQGLLGTAQQPQGT